jgi:hypothetical protein
MRPPKARGLPESRQRSRFVSMDGAPNSATGTPSAQDERRAIGAYSEERRRASYGEHFWLDAFVGSRVQT